MNKSSVVLAVLVATSLMSSPASADGDAHSSIAAPAAARPRPYFIDGGITMRVSLMDSTNAGNYDDLAAYGYDSGRVGVGLRLGAGYRAMPRLDVGINGEYFYRKDGAPRRKTIGMRTHAQQAGLFIRPHQSSPGGLFDLGTRLEVGAIKSTTILRQEELDEISPYLRAQVELLIGRRDLAAMLHVGYMVVAGQDDFDPYLRPRLGGIYFGAGMFHRY
jgi:hypothetical protein